MKKRLLILVLIAMLLVTMCSLFACAGGSKCTEHKWEAYQVVDDGRVQEEICSNCGVTRRLCYPFPHTWKSHVDNGDGTHTSTCGVCGLALSSEHAYDSDARPTPDNPVFCLDCGAKSESKLNPHLCADLDRDGFCDSCGKEYNCDHVYDEGEITEPAGCDTLGEITYTCMKCDDSYTGHIDPIGHNWEDWESNDDGTHTRICANDTSHTETENCESENESCCQKSVCSICDGLYQGTAGHVDNDTEWPDYRCDNIKENGEPCGASTCVEHVTYSAWNTYTHVDGTGMDGLQCLNCGDWVLYVQCEIEEVNFAPSCTRYGYIGKICVTDYRVTFLDLDGFIEPLGHADVEYQDGICDRCDLAMDVIENCDHTDFAYGDSEDYYRSELIGQFYGSSHQNWKFENVTFHWKECNDCQLLFDFGLHEYDTQVTVPPCRYQEGYDVYVCECGKEDETSYSNFMPQTSDHVDENGDDRCDACGEYVHSDHVCADENGDHYCDVCDKCFHENNDGNHYCDYCWDFLSGACYDTDNDDYCDCEDCYKHLVCVDTDNDYRCDDCGSGKNIEHECVDTDEDTTCDYCYKHISHDLSGGCYCWYCDKIFCYDDNSDCICDRCGYHADEDRNFHVDADKNHICDNCNNQHDYWMEYNEHFHFYYCETCSQYFNHTEHEYEIVSREIDCSIYGNVIATLLKVCECGHTLYNCYAYNEPHIDEDGDFYCDVCGNALCDHDEYIHEILTEVTCTQNGLERYTCVECGYTFEETIYSDGHYYEESEYIEGGCETDGKVTYTCIECGDSYSDIISATGHDYQEVSGCEATCTERGESHMYCYGCDDGYIVYTDPLGHIYSDEWIDGYDNHYRICKRDWCGFYDYGYHTHIETSRVEADCETDGQIVKTCVCGNVTYETINAPGHTYGSWVNTGNGYCERVCSANSTHSEVHTCDPSIDYDMDNVCNICGFYICDVIGHVDTDEWHDYRCDRLVNLDGTTCGMSSCIEHQLAPAGPYTHIDGTGHDGHRCANCGDWIELRECNLEFRVFDPSCTKYGYQGYVCINDSIMVAVDTESFVAPKGHADYDYNGICDDCGASLHEIDNCIHNFEYRYGFDNYYTDTYVNGTFLYVDSVSFHWQECTKCGLIQEFGLHSYDNLVTVPPCPHNEGYDVLECVCGAQDWYSRTNFVHPANEHFDGDGDFRCDNCQSFVEHDHVDEDDNDWCEICDHYIYHFCHDNDEDGYCDDCGDYRSHFCYDNDKDQWCDECYSTVPHDCEDVDLDCWCDICGEQTHVDADCNHGCDNCGLEHDVYLSYTDNFHYMYCSQCELAWGYEEHSLGEIIYRPGCDCLSTSMRKCECGYTMWTDFVRFDHYDDDGDNRCDRILENGEECGASTCYTIEENGETVIRNCVDGDNDYLCDNCGHSVCDLLYVGHVYEMVFNENEHWNVCKLCGEVEYYHEEHSLYLNDYDTGGDHFVLRKYYECYCGYGYYISTEHSHSECSHKIELGYEADANADSVCDICGGCMLDDLGFVKTVAPTCTEDGYDLYTCYTCGDENIRLNYVYRTNNHNFEYVRTETWSWSECCSYNVYVCSTCGTEETVDNIEGHEWDEGVIQLPCCTHCEKLYTCLICGDTRWDYVPDGEIGHNMVASEYGDITCAEYSYVVYRCTNEQCRYSYTLYDYSEKPLGHNFGEPVHVPATCTEEGYYMYTCTTDGCGYVKYENDGEDFEYSEHDMHFDRHVNASCEVYGYDLYACSKCAYTYEVTLWDEQPLGHAHEDGAVPVRVVEPGVCQNGYSVYLCSRCDSEFEDDMVVGQHVNYGREYWEGPTCTEDGIEYWYCGDCGASWQVVLPNLGGHVDEDEKDCICDVCSESMHVHAEDCSHQTTDPHYCDEYQVITHTCSECGGTYTEVNWDYCGSEHYDAEYGYNWNGTHTPYCSRCYDDIGYAEDCADENGDGNCDKCGYSESEEDECAHYSYSYYSTDGIWHEVWCDDCGDYLYDEEHNYNDDGWCDDCGW